MLWWQFRLSSDQSRLKRALIDQFLLPPHTSSPTSKFYQFGIFRRQHRLERQILIFNAEICLSAPMHHSVQVERLELAKECLLVTQCVLGYASLVSVLVYGKALNHEDEALE